MQIGQLRIVWSLSTVTLVGQEGALFTSLDWVDSCVHSHICSSGEPAVVQHLSADSSFTWDSGQHWLLLSSSSTSSPWEMLTHPCSISGRKSRLGRAALSAHPLSLYGVLSGVQMLGPNALHLPRSEPHGNILCLWSTEIQFRFLQVLPLGEFLVRGMNRCLFYTLSQYLLEWRDLKIAKTTLFLFLCKAYLKDRSDNWSLMCSPVPRGSYFLLTRTS